MQNQTTRLKRLEGRQEESKGNCPHIPFPVVYGNEGEDGDFEPNGLLPSPCPCGLPQTTIQVMYARDWRAVTSLEPAKEL